MKAKDFTEVYRRGSWQHDGVLSGAGSVAHGCAGLLACLEQLWEEDGMRSVLDLGCGDLEWVSRSGVVTQGKVSYLGVDAVAPLIAHHHRVFPWFRGVAEDLEAYAIRPGLSADLVILKDVLPHLCNGACETIIEACNRGCWRWLLITHHAGAKKDRGRLVDGKWIPVDVFAFGLQGAVLRRWPRHSGDGEYLLVAR